MKNEGAERDPRINPRVNDRFCLQDRSEIRVQQVSPKALTVMFERTDLIHKTTVALLGAYPIDLETIPFEDFLFLVANAVDVEAGKES